MKINHSKPYFNSNDFDSVKDVLTRAYTTNGPVAAEIAKMSASLLGKKYGIAVQSGTDALTTAFKILDLPKYSEVAVPAYVCSAPLDALSIASLKPKVIDIDKDTLSISINQLNGGIINSYVLATHLFGIPAPIYKIKNSFIIEDCAQTLATEIDGRKVGSMGDVSVCSFYSTKLIAAGHGGIIAVDSELLFNKINDLLVHDNREDWKLHYHFLMSDFNAALAKSQLLKLDDMILRRKAIAKRFLAASGEKESIERVVYSRFLVIAFDGADKLIKKFNEAGIEAKRPVYKPLFKYLNLPPEEFPNAEWAHNSIVSVPIYPALTEIEIEYIEHFLEDHKDEFRCWPST